MAQVAAARRSQDARRRLGLLRRHLRLRAGSVRRSAQVDQQRFQPLRPRQPAAGPNPRERLVPRGFQGAAASRPRRHRARQRSSGDLSRRRSERPARHLRPSATHQRVLPQLLQGTVLPPRRQAEHLLGRVRHDRSARPDQSVQRPAWSARLLSGHRRGAHPAVDAAHQLRRLQQPRPVLERLRRGILGTGQPRHHHRRSTDPDRQPVLTARLRPAARQPDLPVDLPVHLLRPGAGEEFRQQPLRIPLPDGVRPLPHSAGVVLHHLPADSGAAEDRFAAQHRQPRHPGSRFQRPGDQPLHHLATAQADFGLRRLRHVLLRMARRYRSTERADVRERAGLHSRPQPQHRAPARDDPRPGRPA